MPSWHQERAARRPAGAGAVRRLDQPVQGSRVPWRIGFADTRAQFETDTLPRPSRRSAGTRRRAARIEPRAPADHALWDAGAAAGCSPCWHSNRRRPEPATYFMPLALAWEKRRGAHEVSAAAAIAQVRQQANVGLMADAFFDEPSAARWSRQSARGASCRPRAGSCASGRRPRRGDAAGDDLDELPVAGPPRRATTPSSCSASRCSSRATAGCARASTPSSRWAASSPRSPASRTACRWPARSNTWATTAAEHARAAAGLCAEPGRRLDLHAGVPGRVFSTSCATRRRRGRRPHGAFLALVRTLGRAHRRAAQRARRCARQCRPSTPSR